MMDKSIIVDTAQQAGKHELKHRGLRERGYELILAPLPVGDYVLLTDKAKDALRRKEERQTAIKKIDLLGTYTVAVDTKKDMQEIYGNIVGKQHGRFRDECLLAQNNGIRLVVLVENTDGIRSMSDVSKWKNKRYVDWFKYKTLQDQGKALSHKIPNKPPTNSIALSKAMYTIHKKYGIEFQFCAPNETASRIINILEGGG